ncbi:MAG: ABC transporter permease [Bacilli bacterium]
MFLATKELKYTKAKFALIIAVIVLVSYLVYFLTSLAYGLASSYTNAVEKWEADEIIITVESNDSMMMSYLSQADFDDVNTDGSKAKLGLFPAVINNPLSTNLLDSRIDVYFFGIEDSFLMPNEVKNLTLSGNKVVVDEELQKEGYKIGDSFGVTGSDATYEIIGFSSKTTYQTAPVVYMSLSTWQEYRYGTNNTPDLFSGIIVQGSTSSLPTKLLTYTTEDYIATLPGYSAQVLTFSTMIVFLIIIVAFVLGIFIYVLTIQKTSMFGVMKAQGISNGYIAGSVIVQTFILVLIGIIIGLILTIITGIFLGDVIPFAINYLFYIVITAAFFLFALFGAMFSVRAVLKIDPLRAIGG